MSGGTSDTSTTFANLFPDLVRIVEKNSIQIEKNSEQLCLLIQIKQTKNRRPVLEDELGGTDPDASVSLSLSTFTNPILYTLQAL